MVKRVFVGYEHASVAETQFETVLAYLSILSFGSLASILGKAFIHTDRDIPLGSNWQETVDKYIFECDILVACVTSSHSPQVQHEIDLARALKKKIISVYPGDASALQVYGIAHLQGLNSTLPDFLAQLEKAVK